MLLLCHQNKVNLSVSAKEEEKTGSTQLGCIDTALGVRVISVLISIMTYLSLYGGAYSREKSSFVGYIDVRSNLQL